MGQTRVDLQRQLEDLRDAYRGPLEETILTEIVASALDSGASCITLLTDVAERVLVVLDDGKGMSRRELARTHDVVTSSKRRGEGIGFAGVGIKLGLLVSAEVTTETRRGPSHVATRWRLASRQKAPWRWIPPPGYVTAQGTAVCLRLRNPLSPLLDGRMLAETIDRHFQPLLETVFDGLLAEDYPGGVIFRVNGRTLTRRAAPPGAEPLAAHLPRKRGTAALGYVFRTREPLGEGQRGIAVSVQGKVIRRGWDWLAMAPDVHDRVAGLVEAPALAEALALNKADFLHSGSRGRVYMTYRKAIQEAVSAQLTAWGERLAPERERRLTGPVERDLEDVLIDLAESFPGLAALAAARGPRTPARYGVTIQLEERAESTQLGWLVDSTVHVNAAHPAYRRAAASHAEAYHLALTVGLSLAPLVTEPAGTEAFVTAFLARWGEALDRADRRGARRRPSAARRVRRK